MELTIPSSLCSLQPHSVSLRPAIRCIACRYCVSLCSPTQAKSSSDPGTPETNTSSLPLGGRYMIPTRIMERIGLDERIAELELDMRDKGVGGCFLLPHCPTIKGYIEFTFLLGNADARAWGDGWKHQLVSSRLTIMTTTSACLTRMGNSNQSSSTYVSRMGSASILSKMHLFALCYIAKTGNLSAGLRSTRSE